MKKLLLGIGVAGMLTMTANAQPRWGRDMNLSRDQRQQIRDILRSGNFNDPATRQQMGQQIANIVGQQNAGQLSNWNRQFGRNRRPNGNGNYGWYNAGNMNGACPPGQAYYPNAGQAYYPNAGQTYYPNAGQAYYPNSGAYYNPGYNTNYAPGYYNPNYTGTNPYAYNTGYAPNGYYPQGYYPGNYYNGADLGLNVLSGLLNSGILNGMFR